MRRTAPQSCKLRRVAASTAIMIGIVVAPLAVSAQQAAQRIPVRSILDRLDRLESEVVNLRVSPPSGYGEDGLARLEQVEAELRRLTGIVERLDYETGQRAERAERRMLDLETRLEALETRGPRTSVQTLTQAPAAPALSIPQPEIAATFEPPEAPEPPQLRGLGDQSPDLSALPVAPQPQIALGPAYVPPQPAPPAEPLIMPVPAQPLEPMEATADPDGEYRSALLLLNQGRFEAAGAAFEEIAGRYGTHPAVGQSKYWLGDMHLRLGRYDLAARAFLEAFRGWPEGPKAPDSLLKLGITLGALGQSREACLTFTQFAERYPNAAPALLQRAQIEAQRTQCGS